MKAKVKKAILDLIEDNIIDIINIDTADFGINVHFLFNDEYHKCYFEDADEINEHLEFNYQKPESIKYNWIREDEVKARLNELEVRKQGEIDYWKDKCIKLLDKI